MPYIPNPIPIVAAKLVGYTLAGIVLNRTFGRKLNPFLFGGIRSAAGLAGGLLTLPLAIFITPYVWYVGLRVALWYGLVRYFYEPKGYSDKTFRIAVLCGIAWSFLIDGVLYLVSLVFPEMMSIPWC